MSAEIIRLAPARAKRTTSIPAQEKSYRQSSEIVLAENLDDRRHPKAYGNLLSAIIVGVIAAWIVDS
jgi:hypothetical protein